MTDINVHITNTALLISHCVLPDHTVVKLVFQIRKSWNTKLQVGLEALVPENNEQHSRVLIL